MTFPAVLEAVVSLSVQVAVLILVTGWLCHRVKDEQVGDQVWRVCHGLVLLLTFATFTIPHLRPIPYSLVGDLLHQPNVYQLADEGGKILISIWLAGFAVGACALILSTAGIQRVLNTARLIPTEELKSRCPQLVTKLPNGRDIRWRATNTIAGPFCWQIHEPQIVLPESVLKFEDDELAALVNHEVAHLVAGHPLSLFFQRLVELFFWYHPLVWWGSWQADRWREFVCDRAAARSADEASACLRSLLKLAEQKLAVTSGMPAGLNFGARRTLTQDRAARLCHFDRPEKASPRQRRMWIGIVVTALAVSALQFPLNPAATDRSLWSPWPSWSAVALRTVDVNVRDYEIDGHRLREHHHRRFDRHHVSQ